MTRLRGKFTYANVVASLALFIAVAGGTAFAAGFGKETIGTRALKKEAVTPLKLSESAKAALVGPKGANGPAGPQGPRGATGLSNQILIDKSGGTSVTASCNPGETLTGGGAIVNGGQLVSSYPNTGPPITSWTGVSTAGSVTVRILCSSPGA
jgi:hypothetical protein